MLVVGVVIDSFGKLFTFLLNLFLEKHRLLLGVNKIDLVWHSSLQRGKEDSQTNQLGHSFTLICQVKVRDREKKAWQQNMLL